MSVQRIPGGWSCGIDPHFPDEVELSMSFMEESGVTSHAFTLTPSEALALSSSLAEFARDIMDGDMG